MVVVQITMIIIIKDNISLITNLHNFQGETNMTMHMRFFYSTLYQPINKSIVNCTPPWYVAASQLFQNFAKEFTYIDKCNSSNSDYESFNYSIPNYTYQLLGHNRIMFLNRDCRTSFDSTFQYDIDLIMNLMIAAMSVSSVLLACYLIFGLLKRSVCFRNKNFKIISNSLLFVTYASLYLTYIGVGCSIYLVFRNPTTEYFELEKNMLSMIGLCVVNAFIMIPLLYNSLDKLRKTCCVTTSNATATSVSTTSARVLYERI